MLKVAVVYHSTTGHTKKMAEAVVKGIEEVEGVSAEILSIEGTDISEGRWKNDAILNELDSADGIIFGSPTFMGTVSAQMKAFMDASGSRYCDQVWKDKVTSGFSVSSGAGGDKFNALMTFATYAMQMGMVWVGLGITPQNSEGINRLSFYFGAAGQSHVDPKNPSPSVEDLKTAQHLGHRVANFTKQLKGASHE